MFHSFAIRFLLPFDGFNLGFSAMCLLHSIPLAIIFLFDFGSVSSSLFRLEDLSNRWQYIRVCVRKSHGFCLNTFKQLELSLVEIQRKMNANPLDRILAEEATTKTEYRKKKRIWLKRYTRRFKRYIDRNKIQL